MKKRIIAGMDIVACAALCAAVWPQIRSLNAHG